MADVGLITVTHVRVSGDLGVGARARHAARQHRREEARGAAQGAASGAAVPARRAGARRCDAKKIPDAALHHRRHRRARRPRRGSCCAEIAAERKPRADRVTSAPSERTDALPRWSRLVRGGQRFLVTGARQPRRRRARLDAGDARTGCARSARRWSPTTTIRRRGGLRFLPGAGDAAATDAAEGAVRRHLRARLRRRAPARRPASRHAR